MDHHLEAVANRALITPTVRKNRELSDILDSYLGEVPPRTVVKPQQKFERLRPSRHPREDQETYAEKAPPSTCPGSQTEDAA